MSWEAGVSKLDSTSGSESYVTTDGQSASLSWYKAHIRGLRPDFVSVRNMEYIWQLHSWFRGAPSLTRGRVCLLHVPLALASAVFFGPSPLGLATVFYCLRFESSLFVASYDSQGHGGGIRPRLHMGADSTSQLKSSLQTLWTDDAENTVSLLFGKACLQRRYIATEVTLLLLAYSLPPGMCLSSRCLFWPHNSGLCHNI
jgi:hypothetical protein